MFAQHHSYKVSSLTRRGLSRRKRRITCKSHMYSVVTYISLLLNPYTTYIVHLFSQNGPIFKSHQFTIKYRGIQDPLDAVGVHMGAFHIACKRYVFACFFLFFLGKQGHVLRRWPNLRMCVQLPSLLLPYLPHRV